MAPNYLTEAQTNESVRDLPNTSDYHMQESKISKSKDNKYAWKIVWKNVIGFIYLHIAALYGAYALFTACSWPTLIFIVVLGLMASQGITAGAHRLWAHKAYKAKLPLRIFLMILQTMSMQNDILEWARDHRVHHKFTDTDADPHNSKRGFFFSHMGWLMIKKHKDVTIKGKTVDMSDLEADPVVGFQRKNMYYIGYRCWSVGIIRYYMLLILTVHLVMLLIVVYIFGEDPLTAFNTAIILRYTLSLHGTWLVNSAAHFWGAKPYDQNIGPSQNLFVAIAAMGEGWHNYHHVFPWDYKTAELGGYKTNISTMFIDFFAKIGLAYDLKTVPLEMIEKRVKRTGDGSRKLMKEYLLDEDNNHTHHHDNIWGWGDADMKKEDMKEAKIYN